MMIQRLFVFILIAANLSSLCAADQVYQSPQDYVDQQFSDKSPSSHYLWLDNEQKDQLKNRFDYQPSRLRLRYWGEGLTTVWVLDEIGKEQPITVGITVQNGVIKDLKVLIYRESRGHEVKQSFFTRQYLHAAIDNEFQLDKTIDGITGATLSVKALNKLARVALYLHQKTPYDGSHENSTQTSQP